VEQTYPNSTTPATTLVSNGHRSGGTAAGTLSAPGHRTNPETKQLSAGMTASLFEQLEERAAIGLVADIVQGVLDENSQGVRDPAAEPAMIAARQRLERLIRADSARLTRSTDHPEIGLDKVERPARRAEADRALPIRPSNGEPVVSVIDQKRDQRVDRGDGRGMDLARRRPTPAPERVTLRQMRERAIRHRTRTHSQRHSVRHGPCFVLSWC
jgi:hypothetical protein